MRWAFLLFVVALAVHTISSEKCLVEYEEQVTHTVNLQPSVCGISSVHVTFSKLGKCKNNGDNCKNYDFVYTYHPTLNPDTVAEQFCVPKAGTDNIVSGSTTITGSNCQHTVYYQVVNVTDCVCELHS